MIKDKMGGASFGPDKPAKVDEYERNRFLVRCRDVLLLLQELPDRADDFAGSCTSTVLSMMDTAESKSVVTQKMRQAVVNIERGAERWKAGER